MSLNSGRKIVLLITALLVVIAVPKSVFAATEGTSSNPYSLTAGTTKSVTSKEYWFKCTVRGATDFSVTTGANATITIYKKTLLGKKELYKKSGVTSYAPKLSDPAKCNNSNTYLVHVKMTVSKTIKCKVSQHKDSKTRENGAMWKAKSTSPMSNTNIIYLSYWYVPAAAVSTVESYVNSSKFLDIQSELVNGTITVGTAVALSPLEATAALAAGIVSGIAANHWGVDFKAAVIDKIKSAGGYSSTTRKYSKGVILVEYMSDGISFYDVKSWNGGTMYGPGGYVGTWTTAYN